MGTDRPDTIAVIGLGQMGLPMARRLLEAGHRVRGADLDPAALAALQEAGGEAAASGADAARGAAVVILMLPNSAAVQEAMDDGAVLAALAPGTLLLDMGSSEPLATRALAQRCADRGVALVDAPVSGGVAGAVAGTLTIMAGGEEPDVARARPVLELLGRTVVAVGGVGAGHAVKAINNLLSATHLLASVEALEIGRAFGLDPDLMLEAINGSSGRSGSTEVKLPRHVVPETYDSGFRLALMLKDMRIALALGRATGVPAHLGEAAAETWAQAARELAPEADHTEIARHVQARRPPGD
ncbi:NAD(P)-dependent oxidoreductase [Baekduia soli]|uniref:NAD(P)-dependent oxidoreductase n=1 Tax=Baekduia soli TaxID=496014 RepID=A0A5B8U956_9ACTN|nr:NAD(P)-dependent oxidoreductase [Baekduia soli]QEC49507.1 NAD(P)-dependent oxidoreductase [Baekduia soli]